MTIFDYSVRQRGHHADRSYRAVISCAVMLFSQCVMCKSSSPAGRSVAVTHQHRTILNHKVSESQPLHRKNPKYLLSDLCNIHVTDRA